MTDLDRLTAALSDRYTIEQEVGAGGMATVYLAHDVKHDRKGALKVLRPELAAVIGAERCLVEIKTTANLQHPHILPLFDSGEADSFLFYVMPFIEGESLRDRLEREKQLPIDDAVRLASEVASALDYAHRHDVIHRDIKPENILLVEGQPQVADFGIALAVSQAGGTRLTETGLSIGTPQYIKRFPQQAVPQVQSTLAKLSLCRTAALNSRRYRCSDCAQECIVYNSCGDRHCPICSGAKRADWIDSSSQLILDGIDYESEVN